LCFCLPLFALAFAGASYEEVSYKGGEQGGGGEALCHLLTWLNGLRREIRLVKKLYKLFN